MQKNFILLINKLVQILQIKNKKCLFKKPYLVYEWYDNINVILFKFDYHFTSTIYICNKFTTNLFKLMFAITKIFIIYKTTILVTV